MPEDRDDGMTRGERVRAAARTLREPRTAAWVADETGVSVQTAQKYLNQLVEDDVLRTIERGERTLYCIDQLMATYREIAALQREHDQEELTDVLAEMRTKIADWKATYDVSSPSELRASIADFTEADDIAERREIASEWEHLADRIQIVRAAVNEYDWASERDTISA